MPDRKALREGDAEGEGTPDIDELAPDDDRPTISNCPQDFEIDPRGGRFRVTSE
ncbi:hypothetical protein [Lentzea sp. NPDC055074]